MKLYFISIFPEIFDSFLDTSLIKKAQEKGILAFETINPRDFCDDKYRQIDDEIYGGGAGMLIKAKPMIDAVNSIIKKVDGDFQIIFPSPSQDIRNQESAHSFSKADNLIFVCGRYEGIDHRFVQYFQDKYKDNFHILSIGKFVTLGGELPTMTMVESIVRLVPGVIKEEASWQNESYAISQDMQNIEYSQYTRPKDICGYTVPEVLLNGNHKDIEDRKLDNTL
ncbi:MAG TPA: tRNA (guanosine(37)-N1)-methyltransferase TrmD [Candidatus Absconditabacterales bacterium]|nr:tRNA (guanosine(37)-N1)-methyltransferase TrmD [Candidatus Absconditabacterales bacterium]